MNKIADRVRALVESRQIEDLDDGWFRVVDDSSEYFVKAGSRSKLKKALDDSEGDDGTLIYPMAAPHKDGLAWYHPSSEYPDGYVDFDDIRAENGRDLPDEEVLKLSLAFISDMVN